MLETINKAFIEENSDLVSKLTLDFFNKIQQLDPNIIKKSWIPVIFFMYDKLVSLKDRDVIHCLLLAGVREDDRNFIITVGELDVSSQHRDFST